MQRALLTATMLAAAIPGFAADVTATDADSGKVLNLNPGDHLVLRLKSNAGTGYRWTLLQDDPAILAPDSMHKVPASLPGGPETTTLVFDAVNLGKTKLAFQYVRPNGNGTSEVGRTISFNVVVGVSTPSIVLSDSDNGGSGAVSVGKIVEVRLRSNRTTGYDWQFATASSSIKLLSDTYLPPNQGIPGAGGLHVTRLQVTKPGKISLRMVYRRPWEKGVPPAKTWTYTLTAKAAPAKGG